MLGIPNHYSVKNRLRYALYRLKWHLVEKTPWSPKYPLHVDLELTNHCNLKCTMCPHGDPLWAPEKGFMGRDTARQHIDRIAELKVPSLKLQFRGESSLHPGLVELVEYAKKQGILEVQLNTNGIPWTKAKIDAISRAGLDRIIISVDGASEKVYSNIRKGGDWHKLLRNIAGFIDARDRHGNPKVRIQLTQQNENDNEINSFREVFQSADEILVKPVRSRNTGKRRPCPQPRRRAVIGWDGRMYACCHAWNDESYVGDADLESWREKTRYMREAAKQPDRFFPCRSCQIRESYR